tara:strand:+ start:476 stop:622 length:147 start_codon:yes stop_codon:yes gene_type:complete
MAIFNLDNTDHLLVIEMRFLFNIINMQHLSDHFLWQEKRVDNLSFYMG